MPQLGIHLQKKGELWVATCKRLGLQAEARTETEALEKCRDAMVLCLRQALRELENMTTEDQHERFLLNQPEEKCEYEDELEESELTESAVFGLRFKDRKALKLQKVKASIMRNVDGLATFSGSPLFKKLGLTNHVGGQALEELVEEGKIQRISNKKYRIAPHAD